MWPAIAFSVAPEAFRKIFKPEISSNFSELILMLRM